MKKQCCMIALAASLAACGGNGAAPTTESTNNIQVTESNQTPSDSLTSISCSANLWCVGAAVTSIDPSEKHIAGVVEARDAAEVIQKMNIGGYGGVNPEAIAEPQNLLTNFNIGLGPAEGNFDALEENGDTHSLSLRAVYLAEPDKEAIMLMTIDAIGTGNVIQKEIKRAVNVAIGIPEDNILLASTHSHSAPDLQGLWGGVPKTWLNCDESLTNQDGCGEADNWLAGVYQKAADVALLAQSRAVAASLATGHTFLDKNRTRSEPGTATQTTDQAMTILSASDLATGNQIATVIQYAAHPTIIGSSNRLLHCDFVYGAVAHVEKRLGGVGMYINGPIADTSASTGQQPACDGLEGVDRDFCRAQDFGRQLGQQATDLIINSGQVVPIPVGLTVRHAQAVLPVTNPLFIGAGLLRSFNRYYNFVETPADDIPEVAAFRELLPQLTPTATTTVSRITLGDQNNKLELATIPGEGRNALGQLLRTLAWGADNANRPMMLMGLTHNSFGYIIPEEEFGGPLTPELPYEETVSLGPLTAPLLRLQAYFPLFDVPQEAYAPAYFSACQDPQDDACITQILNHKLTYSTN